MREEGEDRGEDERASFLRRWDIELCTRHSPGSFNLERSRDGIPVQESGYRDEARQAGPLVVERLGASEQFQVIQ